MRMPAVRDASPRVDGIDSLRAVAVLGVVANHAAGLRGGFLGVDVFFVISGFVITLLMLRQSDAGSFRLRDFYRHRIARIVPPLLLVSVAIHLCASRLFWLPEEYGFIQGAFLHQAWFAQNVFFAERAADYFKGLASAKLNLHLWSLAVEEQFYVIYPVLFLAAYRYRRAWWMWLAAMLVLGGSCLLLTSRYEESVVPWLGRALRLSAEQISPEGMRYYLLPPRAWELLLGASAGAVAWRLRARGMSDAGVGMRVLASGLAVACLAIVVGAMVFTQETMAWPTTASIPPVASTAVLLVLFSTGGHAVLPQFCGNRGLAMIGRSSYSLYLWHWPVLGVLVYTNRDFGATVWDYVLYALVVAALTALTYGAVERNRHRIGGWQSVLVLAAFVVFSVGAGVPHRSTDDFPPDVRSILETGAYAEQCGTCVRDPSGPFVVLWGDSHARMLVGAVEKAAAAAGFSLVHIRGTLADPHEQLASVTRRPGYAGAILASRWSMYAVGFPPDEPEETGDRYLRLDGRKAADPAEAARFFDVHLRRLLSTLPADRPVLLFQEVPRYPFMPKKEALIERSGLRLRALPVKSLDAHRHEQQAMRALYAGVVDAFPNLRLVDPAPVLCPATGCVWREGWNLLYKDDDHLSVYGATKFQPTFEAFLREQDRPRGDGPGSRAATTP